MLARARAVSLTGYCEIARHVGLDPFAMLSRAGLHPSALNDPENWLPASRILRLLDDSARHSGRDDFSILLGECRTFGSLGHNVLTPTPEAVPLPVPLGPSFGMRWLSGTWTKACCHATASACPGSTHGSNLDRSTAGDQPEPRSSTAAALHLNRRTRAWVWISWAPR